MTFAGLMAVLFALLLIALVAALITRRDFRDAVLGGPGEASIVGLLTVKGVAIVLLCGLLIGGILFALTRLPAAPQSTSRNSPITMRLNVHFDPNEVNPRNPQFTAKAFIKTTGNDPQAIPIVTKVSAGGLSVHLEVPDMETPFFIVFETPRGTWKTDDFSIHEAAAVARKQEGISTP